jgi:prepilin-type processing-associated H-X9-DG protein
MKRTQTESRWTGQPQRADAFTLLELLVVLGTVAILAVLLAPALAASKPGGKMAQCLNGKRQLSLAWQMYAADNSDLILGCTSWLPNAFLDWTSASINTNTAYLTSPVYSLLAPYNQSAAIFKCPADYYQSAANPGPRDRSVSLNGGLTGSSTGPTVEGAAPNGHYFGTGALGAGRCLRMSDLAKPGPAAVFAFLDEHPDSINDGAFMNNPGYAATAERWRDLPASYHNGAAGFSFADGHAEMHVWSNSGGQTAYPVLFQSYVAGAPWATASMVHGADYEWVEAHMPYR